LGTAEKNKKGTVEPLIHCSKCLTICKNMWNYIKLHTNYDIKMFVWNARSSNMFGYDIGDGSLH
jgi:hypothetical protein